MDAIGLKGTAGSGAPVVGQNGAPFGYQCLLKIVLGQRAVGGLAIGLDALQRFLIIDQLLAKGLSQYVFGQVVTGGTQAAGGDDNIRPLPGQLHRLLGALRIISHHGVPVDIEPQGA